MKDMYVFTVATGASCFGKNDHVGQLALLSCPLFARKSQAIIKAEPRLLIHFRKRHLYGPADMSFTILIMHFERVCLVCFLEQVG